MTVEPENKENTACAEPLVKAKADVALIQAKVILSIRIKAAAYQFTVSG
ncbi:hypothetical protein [Sporomusa aerivorans]